MNVARFGVLVVGVIVLSVLWWWARTNEPTEVREPSQAERIIEYCSVTINRSSPLCHIPDPTNTAEVEDTVREIIRDNPRVVERVREGDDDDDSSDTRVIVVPTQTPRPRPARTTPPPPATTRPPLSPDIEIPNPPDLPPTDDLVRDLPPLVRQ